MALSDSIGDWDNLLSPLFHAKELEKIRKEITKDRKKYKVYPPSEEVFNAFKECPYSKCKVVFISDRPYKNGESDGLAFSCKKTMSPKLKEIYTEMVDNLTVGDFLYLDEKPSLKYLANQGILFLNKSLTVCKEDTDKHNSLWQSSFFVINVLDLISENKENVLFIDTIKYPKNFVDGFISEFTDIINLNGHKWSYLPNGFLGSKVFTEINNFLKETKQKPIHW